MELHHKLRRDPNWHPSACNICGQLGHQAVNCTNGTINWKQIYGDDAFRLKRPIYESDYQALKKSKQVDLVDLEKRARQYAKMRAESMGIDYAGMTERAAQMLKDAQDSGAAAATAPAAAAGDVAAAAETGAAPGAKPSAEGAAEGAPAAVKPKVEEADAPLPPGWARAKDAQGRTYYWHTQTKAVQWQPPK